MSRTATNTNGIWKLADVLVGLLFVTAIYLPLMDSAWQLDPTPARKENRRLAEKPALAAETIRSYPHRFDDYYNDHFGFRNALIRWATLAKISLFTMVESDRVVVGEEGWLFFKGLRTVDYFRRVEPWPETQVERWTRVLKARHDWLAERGIRYLLVFVPNKSTVYAEHMPDHIAQIDRPSRLELLKASLEENTDIDVLDLTPLLIAGKERQQVFHRTDSHWNGHGMYIAYRGIGEKLREWFPSLIVLAEDGFELPERNQGGDLADMLGIGDAVDDTRTLIRLVRSPVRKADPGPYIGGKPWPPGNEPLPFQVALDTQPTGVLICDSFGMCTAHVLAQLFRRSVFISHLFDPGLIESEQPDVVVHQIVERVLMRTLPADFDDFADFYDVTLVQPAR